MKSSSAFYETRQPTLDVSGLTLWADLTTQCKVNNELHDVGKITRSTTFHVENIRGFAVNVILTAKNDITVRGIIVNDYNLLLTAIDNVRD